MLHYFLMDIVPFFIFVLTDDFQSFVFGKVFLYNKFVQKYGEILDILFSDVLANVKDLDDRHLSVVVRDDVLLNTF